MKFAIHEYTILRQNINVTVGKNGLEMPLMACSLHCIDWKAVDMWGKSFQAGAFEGSCVYSACAFHSHNI